MADFWRADHVACAREWRADGLSCVRDVSLALDSATLTVLSGSHGCGKNLLFRLLGLLEIPEAGEVFLHGAATSALPEPARLALRNRHFGFVFAEPFLLPTLSVIENVAMPLFKISGLDSAAARQPISDMLEFVGLAHLSDTAAGELSRAEQQKISLARALVHRPDIVLVEEAGDLAALLTKANQTFSVTMLALAETPDAWPGVHRRLEMAGGAIVADSFTEII